MRLRPIVPIRTEPRAPAPPAHDGPDRRSRASLDGATALALALARQARCRESLGTRPAGSSAARPSFDRPAFGLRDIDDVDGI